MYNFVFMLKTYKNDWNYVCRLIETYNKYNRDEIPMYIVVPKNDFDLFNSKYHHIKNIVVFSETMIDVDYAKETINGLSPGYINQEIVKLSFWELGLCKNYMCLDSEAYFIRDFFLDEFMYDDEYPYTILVDDNELKVNPNYYHQYWIGREKHINMIMDKLEYNTSHLLTCHGFQIFNVKVLRNFKQDYMKPNCISYLDLIKESPYEFSWYNIWLQKTHIIPLYICGPLFKIYHMSYQQYIDFMLNVNEEELSRGYVGIVMNSNFSRDNRLLYLRDIDKIYWKNGNKSIKHIALVLLFLVKQEIKVKLDWYIHIKCRKGKT